MSTFPKIVETLRGKVNLVGVHLIRGSFAFRGIQPGDEVSEIGFGIQAAGRPSPDHSNVLQSMVGVKIVAKAAAERELAELVCEFALDYEVSDASLLGTFKAEEFADFASTNGMYNAWPFIREFIASITNRMPLPRPIVLPTLAPEMVELAEKRAWGDFGAMMASGDKGGATAPSA